jgi:hypothetical protein
MPEKIGKGERIRKAIENNWDEYKNSFTTEEGRNNFFKEFCEAQDDKIFDYKEDRSLFNKQLKKIMRKKGYKPKSFGLESNVPYSFDDMITDAAERRLDDENTSGDVQESPTLAVKKGPRTKKFININEDAKSNEPVLTITEPDWSYFTPEMVGELINGFWMLLRIRWPILEELTEEERESLGRLWIPAAKKYLPEWWIVIGWPSLYTLALVVSRILDARRKQKLNTAPQTEEKTK